MDQGTFTKYIEVTSGTIQIALEERSHKSRISDQGVKSVLVELGILGILG